MSIAPLSPMTPPDPHTCGLCDDGVSDRHIVEMLMELAETTTDDTLRVDVDELRENLVDTYGVDLTVRETVNHVNRLVALYGGEP